MLKKLIVFLFVLGHITQINARGGRINSFYTDQDGCTHHVTGNWEMQSSYEVDTITVCDKHPEKVGQQTTKSTYRTLPREIKNPMLGKMVFSKSITNKEGYTFQVGGNGSAYKFIKIIACPTDAPEEFRSKIGKTISMKYSEFKSSPFYSK